MQKIQNPVLAGGYPDPSVVRVGEDFYLVNSSFEYFPGLPIHHSKDLVNWTLIGHGLDRKEQTINEICLTDVQSDGGIHAPSIRYHEGRFYIITTNVYTSADAKDNSRDVCTNFIITATDPAGPWSNPVVIKGAPGIDPDIFFDDDGTIWYVGTHTPENRNYEAEGEIWVQQLDKQSFQLIGERFPIWRGTGGIWVEGPHIYKRKGRYYLLCAEGGTGYCHAITVASSTAITGPYLSNDRNPILTSRNLSHENWVHSTGHGDLVELEDGRWFMLCLGVRNQFYHRSNMGRETFLVPVIWERGPSQYDQMYRGAEIEWPVCAPISGRVEEWIDPPFNGTFAVNNTNFRDDFSASTLKREWISRRTPLIPRYALLSNQKKIRLFADKQALAERKQSAFIGILQKTSEFTFSASVHLHKENACRSGIALVQKDNNFVSFTVQRNGKNALFLVHYCHTLIAKRLVAFPANNTFKLSISSKGCEYDFVYQNLSESIKIACWTGNLTSLYYTGALCGLYHLNEKDHVENWTDFSDVTYVT